MRRLAALPLSLILVIALAGSTLASAPRLVLTAARPALDRLTVTVTTTDVRGAAGVWRVELRGTGAAAGQALRLTIVTGDTQLYGTVDLLTTRNGTTRVVARRSLDDFLAGGPAGRRICSAALHACLSPATIVPPADGNGTLRATFTGLARGHYALVGSARFASSAAFDYGPWVRTGVLRI